MTAAELLVSIFIFGILGTLAFTAVINGSLNLKTVRQNTDYNEEARLVLNRMSRELREASGPGGAPAIPYPPGAVNPDATNPDGSERLCSTSPPPCFNPKTEVAITFNADFTDNGIEDHERLTYRWRNKQIILETEAGQAPLVGGNVTAFKISYRSSAYNCDANNDGQVTWQELDSAVTGPCPAAFVSPPNQTLDAGELGFIDQIIIEMSVGREGRSQTYRTNIDLRNQEVRNQ